MSWDIMSSQDEALVVSSFLFYFFFVYLLGVM